MIFEKMLNIDKLKSRSLITYSNTKYIVSFKQNEVASEILTVDQDVRVGKVFK